jgi:cytochrome d ubiquinol oxidase subunit II
MLTIGSLLLPLLIGIALGDLLHGLPINKDGNYTGTFLDLLTPYGIWCGVTLLVLSLAHGATYLNLKTTGTVQQRAQRLAGPFSWLGALFVLGFSIWTHVLSNRGVLPSPIQIVAFLMAVAAAWAVRDGYHGWAFAATTGAIGATVISIFVSLYPNVMVSSTNAAYNLTVNNSASGSYALKVMTVAAVLFVPLVVAYQGWSFHVFRGRVSAPPEQGDGAPVVGPAAPQA